MTLIREEYIVERTLNLFICFIMGFIFVILAGGNLVSLPDLLETSYQIEFCIGLIGFAVMLVCGIVLLTNLIYSIFNKVLKIDDFLKEIRKL